MALSETICYMVFGMIKSSSYKIYRWDCKQKKNLKEKKKKTNKKCVVDTVTVNKILLNAWIGSKIISKIAIDKKS